ncbi:MAG: DUF116 domain-containing protein [Nanobdellota archaeon]
MEVYLLMLLAISFLLMLLVGVGYILYRLEKPVLSQLYVPLFSFLGGPLRRIFGQTLYNKIFVLFGNQYSRKKFKATPFSNRAVFLPQCLRHTDCPARLGTEGIQCVKCGRCGIGSYVKKAENYVYVFVVPGSSFIKRMVRKYNPHAILGVGCLMEVREGLELMASLKIPGQGVVLADDGCVGTHVAWDDVLDATFRS